MKKLFLLSLVAVAVCLFAIPAMADTQKLLNGGFENWSTNGVTGPPNNWFYRTIVPTVTADSTTVRTGTYSAKYYWNSNTTTKLASDTIAVTPGAVYTCSLWIHDNDTSGRARPWFWFMPNSLNPTPGIAYSSNQPGWEVIVWTATCPAADYQLNMEIRGNSEGAARWDGDAEVFVDDMVLWESLPVNNQPPAIGVPVQAPSPVTGGDIVTIRAAISDDHNIVSDSLYFRIKPAAFAPVTHDSIVTGSNYWFHMGPFTNGDSIEYFIAATDDSLARSTSATYSFAVIDTALPYTAIAAVQYNTTNPGGTAPDTCYPAALAGQTVKLHGIVTGVYQRSGYRSRYFLQDADSVWSGILVFNASGPDSCLAGDSVTVVGTVQAGPREYYGMTELVTPITTTKHASGRPLPAPIQVTAADLGGVACGPSYEKYEGCYVELQNFTVTSTTGSAGYVYWWGSDGSGDSCTIWNGLFYSGFDMPTITVGQTYSSIKGCVDYTYGKHCVSPSLSSEVVAGATPPSITGVTVYPSPMVPLQQVTLKATITSVSGTIASDSMYYALNAGAFVPVIHDSIVGTNYWFSMASTYVVGDSVTYYVVATDNIAQRTQTANGYFIVPDTSFCGADSIYNIQYTINGGVDSTCFPTPYDDQIVNICGVVTAVRQGSNIDAYIVDTRTPGGPSTNWTSMLVYDRIASTGDTLKPQLGDKVEINGRVNEYWGTTEIDSLISFTVRGSANAFDTTHVHVIDLLGGCNFGSEAYEGVLVRLDSVTVLSTYSTVGFWIKDRSSADSIYMMNSLWSGGTNQPNPLPSTGASYLHLIGVVRYEGNPAYTQGYYLLPRIGSDFVPLVIPQANVRAAWSIDPTHVGILFDRAMQQASAETPSHYTSLRGLTVSAAVLDTSRRRVTLTTTTQTDAVADTFTVIGVVDSVGITMTSPRYGYFRQGYTPISLVQTPKSPTNDTSAIVYEVVTVKGVVVADSSAFHPSNMYINDVSDTIHNGLQFYMSASVTTGWLTFWPALGDTVVVTSMIKEYFHETETDSTHVYRNVRLINHGPAPAPYFKSSDPADFAYKQYSIAFNVFENHEGVLSKLCDSLIAQAPATPDAYTQLLISMTTGDTVSIEGQAIHCNYAPRTAGTRIDGITGILRFRQKHWRLVPRDTLDFNTGLDCGTTPPECEYLIGDISGDGQRLGGDVTYGVRYFKGVGTAPRDSCFMDSTGTYLYVAGDCNGNCEFRGSDITRLVAYFKGTAHLSCCHWFPTTLPPLIRPVGSDQGIIRDRSALGN